MTDLINPSTNRPWGQCLGTDPGRKGEWMQTWSGKRLYPTDPNPKDVDILDVLHALATMSRYNGQCHRFVTLEHSILVCRMVSKEHKRQAFAHDFDEYAWPDLHRPGKRSLKPDSDFLLIAKGLWTRAICPAFGLEPILHPEVIEADTAVCTLEKAALFPRSQEWDLPEWKYKGHGLTIRCLDTIQVFFEGLDLWCELSNYSEEVRRGLVDRAMTYFDQDFEARQKANAHYA